MNIINKSIQSANMVFVFSPDKTLRMPETHEVMALYSGEASRGSNFLDDAALKLKLFNFPELKMKIICEENRLRIEDESQKPPEESQKAPEALRVLKALFPRETPAAFGFNFDIFYRFDQVIPERDILGEIISDDIIEDISGFSWQFTLKKDKLRKNEIYYFKIISPLEIALHINHHFMKPLPVDKEALQALCEESYNKSDDIFKSLTF